MSGDELVRTCREILGRLDELEALIRYVPKGEQQFIWRIQPEVKELLVIGRYEVGTRATPEQVQHVATIHRKVTSLHKNLPQDKLDALRRDD